MNDHLKLKSINSNLGLPSNQVHAITQDSDGRIWLAGPAGLSCYDGSKIKVFDNQNGLQCQGLRTVAVINDIIWIGTDRGLETIYTNGNKLKVLLDQDWIYGLVERIVLVGTSIWLGTSNALLKLEYNAKANTANIVTVEKLGFVRDLVKLDENCILAAIGPDLFCCTGNHFIKLVDEDMARATVILCVHGYSENKILAGTEMGMFVIDRSGKTIDHLIPIGDIKKVNAISSSGNELWLGVGTSVLHYEKKGDKFLHLNSFPVESSVNSIFVDDINNVWIGTNSSGAKKISCLRTVFKKINTGVDGAVYSIRHSKKNILRVGGETFYSTLQSPGSPEHSVTLLPALPPTTIWDSCEDPINTNKTWLATQDGLFFVLDAVVEQFGKNDPVLKSPTRCLQTRGTDIYVGTLNGLAKISGETIEPIPGDSTRDLGYVYSLELDNRGDFWIGTLGKGLWHESGNVLKQVTGEFLNADANTYAALPNKNEEVIVIQDEQLILIDKTGKSKLILQEYPVAGWSVSWLDNDNILVGSNVGLLQINLPGKKIIKRVDPLLGIGGWQFTNNKALLVASVEKIYCGLNAGLYEINLNGINDFAKSPKLKLDNINWENGTPELKASVLHLKSGKWSMEAFVYCAWFTDEDLVRYRFKLIGFDENWSALQIEPKIKFTSLPPGKYELIGQVYTSLTGYGDSVSLAKLKVESIWWTLGLFKPVKWLTNSYDRHFLSGIRNRKLIDYNHELEAEITERTFALKQKGDELEASQINLLKLIDDLKLQSEELDTAKIKAEEADRLKSAFLASMSHELRTPLNSIIGFTDILLEEYAGPLNAEQAKQLGIVHKSGNHLLSLINDILDLSKIEAGQLIIENKLFSLHESITKVVSLVMPSAEKKNLELSVNSLTQLQKITGDQRRLEQVLLNLLNNAIKFSDNGGILLSVEFVPTKTEVQQPGSKGVFRFTVSDSGIGIKPEDLSLLFKPFSQIDSKASKNYHGTGLGLAICKNLTALMGGTIKAESEFGKGSSFSFSIPVNQLSQ